MDNTAPSAPGKTIVTQRLGADATSLAEAGALIRDGGVVAFPTETVYGLGADATNDRSVAAIYAAKARPSFNPLIVHVESLDAAERYGDIREPLRMLAERFWPGALTLVVQKREDAGDFGPCHEWPSDTGAPRTGSSCCAGGAACCGPPLGGAICQSGRAVKPH